MNKLKTFSSIAGFFMLLLILANPTRIVAKENLEVKLTQLEALKASIDTVNNPLSKYYVIKLNMDQEPFKFDTISVLYNNYIAVLDYLNDEAVPVRYIAPNPYYYRITIPLAYYNSPIKRINVKPLPPFKNIDKTKERTENLLPYNKSYFTQVDRTNELVDKTLLQMYLKDVSYAYTTEDQIMGHKLYIDKILDEEHKAPTKHVNAFLQPDENIFSDLTMVNNELKRPNWWHTGGEGSLQVTQNYFSENWYKGGETNNSVLGNIRLFANYNDQKRLQIENLFEAKLGFNTVPSDTIRSYRVNSDLIRISTKIGIKAKNNSKWFYTVSSEVNTQFSRNFKKNTTELMSSFMTPFNFIIGLGMDFKEKTQKVNFSVVLSPASYNFRYLRNDRVNPSNFGMKKNRSTLHDVGSKLDSTIEWKIISSIRLQSKLACFTNYSKVIAEWESTLDFILNRYLSTKLFFHARFDDSAKRVNDRSYFQIKELLSFGINYKW